MGDPLQTMALFNKKKRRPLQNIPRNRKSGGHPMEETNVASDPGRRVMEDPFPFSTNGHSQARTGKKKKKKDIKNKQSNLNVFARKKSCSEGHS